MGQLVTRLADWGLNRFVSLDKELKPDSAMFSRLVKLDQDGLNLGDLADRLRQGKIRKVVANLIDSGASASELKPSRLIALEKLEKIFESQPALTAKLVQFEQQASDVTLESLTQFIRLHGEDGKNVLKTLVDKGAEAHHFSRAFLQSFRELGKSLNADGALTDRLLSLAPETHYHLSLSVNEHQDYLKGLIERNASAREFDVERIRGVEIAAKTFGNDSPHFAKLMELEKDGLSIKDINAFVAKTETNKALIEKMLDKGATAVNFTEQSLNAFQIVDSVFDGNPAFNKKIFALQSNGYRSFSDLGTYVLESPVQNKAEVESMIMAGGATPEESPRVD